MPPPRSNAQGPAEAADRANGPAQPTPAAYVRLEHFLNEDEQTMLATIARSRLDAMEPSTVYDPDDSRDVLDAEYRRSRVDAELDELWPLFEDRLVALLPLLRRELGVGRFPLGSIERQLTIHGHGDFFAQHVDENEMGTNGARAITFVYYFDLGDSDYRGGSLRLYDTVERDGFVVPAENYVEFEPTPNTIVFFTADASHEVTPIQAPDPSRGVMRSTVNGWYRAGDMGREAVPRVAPSVAAAVQERLVPRVAPAPYTVSPTPPPIHELLAATFELRANEAEPEEADATLFPFGPPDLIPLDGIGADIVDRLHDWHERWAGTDLEQVGAYGLRVYRAGQTTASQVDRPDSHIVTSLLQVDQAGGQPWPLRLRMDGAEHDVRLSHGQMLTYEGASIPHWRPQPLASAHSVLLLVHYRPLDWSMSMEDILRQAVAEGLIDAAGRLTGDLAP